MLTTNILNDINSSYINEISTDLKPLISKDITNDIINGIKNKTYPITIILLKDNKLIGFYQIVNHDNDNTSYTPWLANVFIKEEYRHQGYGRFLINTIPTYMDKLNFKTLYLHTRHQNLYEKFGWHLLEPLDLSDGIKRNIYILKLN